MKFWEYFDKKKRKIHRNFENLYEKYCAINFSKNDIKTLVIGSSHGLYGYRAEKEDFNLCDLSQDLYTSFELYKRYVEGTNLKNVILFYSIFSNGFELSKTHENFRCAGYKYFFNIDYDINEALSNDIELLSKIFKLNKNIKNYYGNFEKYKVIHSVAKERIKTHLRENQRNNLQNEWLKEIINITQNKNHNFYICIAPAREDYRKLLPDKEELFKSLYEISSDKTKILNFYDNTEFNYSDFCDTDHLNLQGAKKLTKMIKSFMIQ